MRSAFGGRFIEAAQKPVIAALSACGIALYLAYHLTRFQVSAVWPLAPRGDASIVFDQAHAIFERAAYPSGAIFPYPPSAILIFYGLSLGGPAVFMTAWYFLMAAGLIVCLRASLVQERNETRAAWLLVGLVSILIADAPIAWDLRNANSNLICIGLVMAGYALVGRLPVLAGILIALAFSIKLYSGLLLVYLFLNGPRRATAAAAATVFILWLGLPVGLFGTDGALKLYSGWSDQVRIISDPSLHASLATRAGGPPIVSLQKAVVNLTGAEFGSDTMRTWLLAIESLWLAALLVYAWRCRGTFCVPIPSRAALADWVVLMLAPLPFSPWLEPYHAVPVLVAVLLCVAVALDDNQLRSDRMTVLAAMAALLFFIVVQVPFGFRGFGLVAQFFTLVLALAYLRPRLAKQTHQRPP
jgi:Glycosyltransferase family 87